MAGQLRSALDQFAGVQLVQFSVVATLLVVYILLIGPVDYFVLRRWIGRMEWTWLTFPAMVVIFSVGAYMLAHRLKGDELRVNQVDLVDVDVASGKVRGTSWMNVFSPRTEPFDLSVDTRFPSGKPTERAAAPLGWLGLPGKGLGGMDPPAAGPAVWNGQYEFAPLLNAIRGVPIQVWSTRSLTARWSEATPAVGLQATLTDEDQLLDGEITSRLDFPLSKCILAYEHWAYDLKTIEPGQSVPLGAMTQRSELRTLLTSRKLVLESEKDAYHRETAVYDQGSTDVPYVLRMMMFYQAAGGYHYTGLTNDYQRFVDLSDLLKTGCAVLVGQASDDHVAAEWQRDGHPLGDAASNRHTVFYRFVLPVKKSH